MASETKNFGPLGGVDQRHFHSQQNCRYFAPNRSAFIHLKETLLALSLTILVMLSQVMVGCSRIQLGLKSGAGGATGFAGLQSLNLTTSGSYILFWNHDSASTDISSITYDIYMDHWTSIPTGLVTDSTTITAKDEGTMLTAKFAQLADVDSPIGKGTKIGTVKGERYYKLDIPIAPDTIYAFAVRSVNNLGVSDNNQRILIYTPVSDNVSFNGVSGISTTSDGKLMISWDPVTFKNGGDSDNVTYQIFMDSSKDTLENITAGALIVQVGLTTLGSSGQVMDFPASKVPSTSLTPLAEVKKANFLILDRDLASDITYLFQVRARSAAGEMDNNRRVLVYQRYSLKFAGLLEKNVTLASDSSTIKLTWSEATGGTGSVGYVIYQDSAFSSVLAQTNALSYTLTSLTAGKVYTLGVRARDSKGLDNNTGIVVIPVPDPSDHTPPVFAGLTSAATMNNSKILLKWGASTSNDICSYNIYLKSNLASPIASTSDTSYVAAGLSSGTNYTFIVRAVDSSGNEDTNKVLRSATTLSYSVPDFSGLDSVTPAGGVAGLTQVTLSWVPAGGSVTGYYIYGGTTTSSTLSYITPLSNITARTSIGSNAGGSYVSGQYATSATVTGLSSGSTYYFAVRAFYDDGASNILSETNQIIRSGTANTVKAPTFAGASAAAPASGNNGLNSIVVNWPTPSSDGVWDSFRIDYEPGTCSQSVSATTVGSVVVSGSDFTTYTVGGLLPNTNYHFRVRARYSLTGLVDSNNACVSAITTPSAPTFNGIDTLSVASSSAGFSALNVSWSAAIGSFSQYLVEWSTSSSFASSTALAPITVQSTTSTQITGLPANTTIYARVSAIFTGVTPNLSAGAFKVLSAITTPTAPSGEGVSSVTITSPNSLMVRWTAPTNAGSIFSGFKLWRASGAIAAADIFNLTAAPYQTANSGILSFSDTGLTAGTQYCYQIRAYYSDGLNTLASTSITPAKCQTPVLVAPAFDGIVTLTAPISSNGFSQLDAAWTPISSSDSLNFSCYQVSATTSAATTSWPADCTSVDSSLRSSTTSSYSITGLSPATTYYVKVRAVNISGSNQVSSGSAIMLSALTTPMAPTGDDLASAASSGVSSIDLSYSAPSATGPIGGLFNTVFLYVYQGTASSLDSYVQQTNSNVTSLSSAATFAAGQVTLATAPTSGTLIMVPRTELTLGTTNTLRINGLTTGQPVCVKAAASYWVLNNPLQFLQSTSTTANCATPVAVAPTFGGVASVSSPVSSIGFNQLNVSWTPISASDRSNFSYYEVQYATSPTPTSWSSLADITSDTASSASISGLTDNTTYYVRVLATNATGTTPISNGASSVISATTTPKAPTGDTLSASQVNGLNSVQLSYTAPSGTPSTGGLYNNLFLWIKQGNATDVATYQIAMGTPVVANITASATSTVVNLASAPVAGALIQIPSSYLTAGASNTITINGLAVNQQVCARAAAVYWVSGQPTQYLLSQTPSTKCETPILVAPTFSGISSLAAPVSSSGFNQLTASWSAVSVSDTLNFSCYQVSVTSSAGTTNWPADCSSVDSTLRTLGTSSYTITGLTANTQYYVRVRAININGAAQVSNGDNIVVSGLTTPTRPTGDDLAAATSGGVTSINLTYTPPSATASVGGLFNNVFLYVYQGIPGDVDTYIQSVNSNVTSLTSAATFSSGQATLSSAPTSGALIMVPRASLTLGTTNTLKINGLTTGQQVCVKAFATYWISGVPTQFLQSTSTSTKCGTPIAVAPTFSGVASVSAPVSPSGFSQLMVTWPAIAAGDAANFSYYEVQYATSPNPGTWSALSNITNSATTSANITGLTANTAYYVRVLATNNNGTTPVSNGGSNVISATTTPKAPTGDGIATLVSASSTSVQLTYTNPSATALTVGLYNNLFIWIKQGLMSDLSTYIATTTPASTFPSITFASTVTPSSQNLTDGTMLAVPLASLNPGGTSTFTISGLTANQQICIRTSAVYFELGLPARYLASQTPASQCITPTSSAPIFTGVNLLEGFLDTRDFTQIKVNWGAITGECTGVQISASINPLSPNFITPAATASCSATSYTLTGLTAGKTYYIQVKANNSVCGSGDSCSGGQGAELFKTTLPPAPSGDRATALSFTTVNKGSDTAAVTYTRPTSGTWNKVYIWRATGSTTAAATTAVQALAATKADNSGPSTVPTAIITNTSTTSYADSDSTLVDGTIYCYLVKGVYESSPYYSASANSTVQCGPSSYTQASFAGLATTGSSVIGSWADHTPQIKLQFASLPSGGVEEYWVYSSNSASSASFDFNSAPAYIVDNTAVNANNPSLSGSYIYLGGNGEILSAGNNYFVVRVKHYNAPTADADSNTAVSNAVVVPFVGVSASGAQISGSWSDGSSKIVIPVLVPPLGAIGTYNIYLSNSSNVSSFNLSGTPWQSFAAGAAGNNPTATATTINVGGAGRTFSGANYFIVRFVFSDSSQTDTNSYVSNLVTVPSSGANYVHVAPSISRLSYDYYIAKYEASLASGSLGADSVSATETSLASCNHQFHTNSVLWDSSCGTKASSAVPTSIAAATPVTATWHQAYASCRNGSVNGIMMRLPTEEEWRRASKFAPDNYANMWTVYSNGSSPNCNTTSGAAVNTGSRSSCVSMVGAYDMVGNVREWVDQRLTNYSISGASESRFSYGPTIGRRIANGIDTQASAANTPVTRRYHNITPGSNNLGLLLGSNYQSPTSIARTSNSTNGTTTVSTGNTSGLAVGQAIWNASNVVPLGTVVTAITTNFNFSLSNAATTYTSPTWNNIFQKQYDAETEFYLDPTLTPGTGGFRCVAWPNTKVVPTMAQLAQTSEPVYDTTTDLPTGHPENWVIPENLYTKDVRPETVTHNVVSYPFPNVTNLVVWPMNGATGAASATDITGNGKNLTVNGTFASAAGIDGSSYVNTFDGSTNYLKSTDTLFNVTGQFTMGGWFYRSSWAVVGSNQNLLANFDGTAGRGYSLQLMTNGNIGFVSYASVKLNVPYTSLSAGWHHIVAVWTSSTSYTIYVDGSETTGSTSWPLVATSAVDFEVGAASIGTQKFTGRMANVFFHSGIAYSAAQIATVYNGTMNFYYIPTLSSQNGVNITWKPWSKKVCTSSCSDSSNTGFTYYIYRYIEPSKVDVRTTIPWAIQTTGSYNILPTALGSATAMPLDPLATDANGNELCSADTPMCVQVATICGSSTSTSPICTSSTSAYCNTGNTSGCTFTDSAALHNGFTSNAIYNYIVVVRDGEGNYQVPKVQRYRSPYFTSDYSQTATASFRTEQRWRRAAPFLLDETYQQAQTMPEIMSYVPMDQSGLDHDFFIQKYIAANYSGTATNGGGYPQGGPGNAPGWSSNAGTCYENLWRTGTINTTYCGTNNTNAKQQSKQGTTAFTGADQGAFWMACSNSGITDGASNTYFLRLTTDPEWIKAADWGNTDQLTYVTTGYLASAAPSIISNTIGTLESGTGTDGYCATGSASSPTSASVNTRYCRSRYGVADMISNVGEWATGQIYTSGYDNGVDGLWTLQSITATGGMNATSYDLLLGLPMASRATVSPNADSQTVTAAALMGSMRAPGDWASPNASGRWSLGLNLSPTSTAASGGRGSLGGRCSR